MRRLVINLESPEILEVVGMLRNSAMLFEDICSFQQCASSAGATSRVGDFWAWNSECIVAGQKLEKVCDFLSPRLFQPLEQPFQPQSPSLGICHFGHKAGWKRTSRGTIGTTADAAVK
jgi:hypothetical protein